MKKLFLISLICFQALFGICQGTVSISSNGCQPFQSCFYSLDPNLPYTYNSIITPPANYTIDSYLWTAQGYFVGNPAPIFTNPSCTVYWQNSPNYSSGLPAHTIKLKVKFKTGTAPNYTYQEITSSIATLEVRYISPFTSFSANGNSIANNGNYVLPCGIQTVNVVTNTLVGDPVPPGITYTWTSPAGWTGPSTTTGPTASFQSTAGTGGILKVQAKRNDGNYVVSWTINVQRPIVGAATISGSSPSIVCSGGTTNLTATATNATGYNWTPSTGNISIVSGQGSGSIYYSAAIDGNVGNISVVGTNACGTGATNATRAIFRGVAPFTGKYVNGGPSQSINLINNPAVLSVSAPAASSINWNVATGSGAVYPSGFSASAYAYPFTTIKAQTNNQCGLGEQYFFYLQQNGSSLMRVGPNPAKNTLAVNFVDGLPDELLPDNITLFDGDKKSHFSNDAKKLLKGKDEKDKTVNIDTSTLPRGNYYLHVTNSNYSEKDKQVEKIKIILE